MLRLPRLISSGCVLQQGEKTRIFGFAGPGETVTVRLQNCTACGTAGGDGRFDVYLKNLRPGGPFLMTVESTSGERICLDDVYVGEVWLGSGQSNMELPVARVRDRYPGAVEDSENPDIHMFQVSECCEFGNPLEDCRSGEWKTAGPETVLNFSALCLFFAQYLEAHCKVPVGIINVSLGGSPAEAWMSREALAEEPRALAEADVWRAPGNIERQQRADAAAAEAWEAELRRRDSSCAEDPGRDEWSRIRMPGFLADNGLEDFIGCIWLRRRFLVPRGMAGTKASLWLGTMTDSDDTYVNGVLVGQTAYQYPPRKYQIPEGLLQEGENELLIRLVCRSGRGRLTPGPGKVYRVFNAQGVVELAGTWEFRISCRMDRPAPEQTFISWMPTGLYNGMLHPCQNYTVKGILWYQGESNDKRPRSYGRLLKKLICSWRKEWGKERLPFLIVQLPGFEIDLTEDGSWPMIRQAQQQASELPDTAVTVNLDLGEKDDLHPTGKREVARRLYLAALRIAYGEKVPCTGPVPVEAVSDGSSTLRITFAFDVEDAEKILTTTDGKAPGEFELAGADGVYSPAEAEICRNTVLLKGENTGTAVSVRYAWRNAPDRGLLCSASGLLTSPFELSVKDILL